MDDFASLCTRARAGDPLAAEQLMQKIYPELHIMARARLRQSGHLTLLDTTALINEMWLRLNANTQLQLAEKHYFLGYASRAMRSIVIDYARRRQAERHGGSAEHVELSSQPDLNAPDESELLRVHDALNELEQIDPRLAQVVELRYFAGLSEEQTADFLGIARRTVQRDWLKARALLFEALC
ncbi:ECF-type sigma factor [Undibacterium sp. CY21W]|uniref:ECF-type sigma factor n=1 Tax=Undibacterium sp. CY21W TaxID=2762293 RepID=UPI00164A3880|nr:ECF-type sigma factor [Undibacterium sp. CY21W]MBC3928831.1 sigma-70 family RNA polymerase sigma factor [Undibacterium sp. CY21W]